MPETTLTRKIQKLSDAQAIVVLNTYTNKYLKKKAAETKLTAEMKKALTTYLKKEAGNEAPTAPESDGSVARTSLLLLASDARRAKALVVLVEEGSKTPAKKSAKSQAGKTDADQVTLESITLGTVALATVCIVVLQTHVVFERDKDGKLFVRVEKKPTETGLITPIVRKILGG
ncbi:MAG: hypothetical protein U0794_20205 [Isosphaeraceae bacterium]